MSDPIFIPLADAVVNLLNAGQFSQQFTATRIYDPLRPLEETETFRLDVILGDRESTPLDRSRQKDEVRIEIVARQIVAAPAGSDDERTILDSLVGFLEEIDNYVSARENRRPPGADWAGWQGSKLVYPYLPAKLRGSRQFVSLLRETYLAARA